MSLEISSENLALLQGTAMLHFGYEILGAIQPPIDVGWLNPSQDKTLSHGGSVASLGNQSRKITE